MKKLNLFLIIAGIVFSLNGKTNDNPKSRGYFVNILSAASNGGIAIIGNKENPEAKKHLNCEGAFQSESIFSVICSSDQQPESPHSAIRFHVWLTSQPQNATLIITQNRQEITAELTCTRANFTDQNRPLATCH